MSFVPPLMYDENIFAIKGYDSIHVLEQDSGAVPSTHQNYQVDNVGRSPIHAILRYGNKATWIGQASSVTIGPGQSFILDNGKRLYHVTDLKLKNNTNYRAIVCVHTIPTSLVSDYYNTSFKDDLVIMKALKAIASIGVKLIPYDDITFSNFIEAFWPMDKPNVWEQIKEHIEELVDAEALNTIILILNGDIRKFKEKIKVVESEVEAKNRSQAAYFFLIIAKKMVGFEKKFLFSNFPAYKKVNILLLPMYSQVILMILTYHIMGIKYSHSIGLTSTNVKILKNNCVKLLREDDGAISYITRIYKEEVDEAYQTKDPRGIYNALMEIRSYITVNGLEYIPYWNYLVDTPLKVYNDVISYSTYYGRQTSRLVRIGIPEPQFQPLTPNILTDGKRNVLRRIIIFIWRMYNLRSEPKIGGMRLIFRNSDDYYMGTITSESHELNLENTRIREMTVWGKDVIDSIVFKMSDGNKFRFGSKNREHNYHETFHMPGHNIASIYLSSDFSSTGGQANNIAVSYQPIMYFRRN